MDTESQPFPNGKQDCDIDQARVRQFLDSSSNRNVQSEKLTECWDNDWSPDGKLFAWSSGQRVVQLIPTEKQGNEKYDDKMKIDCRQIVCAVAFADCRTYSGVNEDIGIYRMFQWENHGMILAVGLRNGRIRIYDAISGKIVLELIDHRDKVTKLAFAPDRSLRLLSSSTDQTIKFWDLADDGNMYKSFKVGEFTETRGVMHKVKSVAWSPDSRRVAAVGSFRPVLLFDATEKKFIGKFTGHQNKLTSCDFSPDGMLLVTASTDSTAIIWNSYTGDIIARLGHQFPAPSEWFPGDDDTAVQSCRFLSNGLQVVTVASDGYVRFWDLSQPTCPVSVCTVDNPLCCVIKPGPSGLCAVGDAAGNVSMIQAPSKPLSLSQICRLRTNSSLIQPASHIDYLYLPPLLKTFLKYQLMD